MIAEIGASGEMILDASLDGVPPEQPGVLRNTVGERIHHQRPQQTPQPFVRGNIKTGLLLAQNRGREFVPHQLLEHEFLA